MLEAALKRVSALGTRPQTAPAPLADGAGVRVAEEPLLPVQSLRSARSQATDTAALTEWLGAATPTAANRFGGDAHLSCAWVEPRAWLLLGAAPAPPAAARHTLLITDLSDRHAAFRVSGGRAGELLAAALGGPAALEALRAGRCVRSKFAEEVEVFVQQFADAPADYRLLFDAGLAHYAADWLCDAARLLTETRERP